MEATPAATNRLRNMKGGPQDSEQKVASRYATEFKDLDEPLRDFVVRKGGINKCAARFARRLGRDR